ncbi:ATP synthase E chain-domain-containing protein [Spinellus fusiger]|nr:ATP synthase E chain-domain-containing protein [Spinellus fusiger]
MFNRSVVNVGRWSALAFGVVYGYSHHATLKAQNKQHEKDSEYHRKELLIQQAQAAYAKKQLAASASVVDAPVASVEIIDIESPNFDFEKFVAKWETEEH